MPVTRVLKHGDTEASRLQLLPWLELDSTEPDTHVDEKPAPAPAESSPPRLTDLDIEQAFQRGLREGREANRAAQESASAVVRAELAKAIAELSSLRSSLRRTAQMDMLRLAVAIARRIVHRELSLSPDIMEGIVSVALEKLDRQESYRVRVHPSLAAGVEREIRTFAHHQNVQVIPDANLAVGACRVETNRGNVDASIESQLLEIERGLADRLEAAR